jgi:hypothetical protein
MRGLEGCWVDPIGHIQSTFVVGGRVAPVHSLQGHTHTRTSAVKHGRQLPQQVHIQSAVQRTGRVDLQCQGRHSATSVNAHAGTPRHTQPHHSAARTDSPRHNRAGAQAGQKHSRHLCTQNHPLVSRTLRMLHTTTNQSSAQQGARAQHGGAKQANLSFNGETQRPSGLQVPPAAAASCAQTTARVVRHAPHLSPPPASTSAHASVLSPRASAKK